MPPSDYSNIAHRRIVVCEDEGIVLMQLRRGLQRAGVHVVGLATNADDVVSTVLQNRPDMVLLNVSLGKRGDGIEALNRFLPQHPCCVVMLSGVSDATTRDSAINAGASGYIVKPIDTERMLMVLAAIWRLYQLTGDYMENALDHAVVSVTPTDPSASVS